MIVARYRPIGDDGAVPWEPAGKSCHFLGGIVSSLFGGGSDTSVTSTNSTNVTVEVNPQIGVAVDLEPVAQLADEIAAGNVATGEAVASALTGQGQAFAAGFEALAGELDQFGKVLLFAAGAAALVWYMQRS